MKKIFLTSCVMIFFFAVSYGFAQMGHGHGVGRMQGGQEEMHPDMGTQMSSQMLSGQMMQSEMMRSMSEMMSRMNEMMRAMSQAVEKPGDWARKQDMSLLMDEMSLAIHDMSEQIGKAPVDIAMMKKMQERMKTMHKMLDKIQERKKLK